MQRILLKLYKKYWVENNLLNVIDDSKLKSYVAFRLKFIGRSIKLAKKRYSINDQK